MGINIEIKNKMRSELSIQQIAELKGLRYGVSDNNFVLQEDEEGYVVIFYDPRCIGRGIEYSAKDNSIFMRLALPAGANEIILLYSLAECICDLLGAEEFYRDEETVPVMYAKMHILGDTNVSMRAVEEISWKIRNGESEQFCILGALNPIYIGIREINETGGTLEGFERLMNRLQQIDAFFPSPRFYRREDGSVFGVYFVGTGIRYILSPKPYVLMGDTESVSSWYVLISKEQHAVRYSDFIASVAHQDPYDAVHFMTKFTEDEIMELVYEYGVDIWNDVPDRKLYWGKDYDFGQWHYSKIEKEGFDLDFLAGYNHIAVFVRWCAQRGLLDERLVQYDPDIIRKLTSWDVDIRKVIHEDPIFSGHFRRGHLKKEYREFADEFYVFAGHGFPECVDMYSLSCMGEERYNCDEYKNEAYLFMPYDEEYYNGLSKYIDEAWQSYTERYKRLLS